MEILNKIWKKKHLMPVGLAIIVIGFVLYFWKIFSTNIPNEIIVNSDNSSLWIIVSLLVVAVCIIVINQSFFQEKIFDKFRNIFIQVSEFEDNVVYLTRDLKSDIHDILKIIDKGNDDIACKFGQNGDEQQTDQVVY